MAIVSKSFLHNDDKIVGASGDADGNLAEDVQDWITSQDAELVDTTNVNILLPNCVQVTFKLVVATNSASCEVIQSCTSSARLPSASPEVPTILSSL